MSGLDDELTIIFRDEAAGRLDQMETALLAVESGDAGMESVDSLFRNAHTIKGAAGMLGLDDICALARAVEEVLAAVRAAAEFQPALAAPLLRATAVLRAQVSGAAEPVDEVIDDLGAAAAALAGGAGGVPAAGNGKPPPAAGNGKPAAPARLPRARLPRRPRLQPRATGHRRSRPRRRLPGSGRGSTRCVFRPRRSTACLTSSGR